MHFIDDTRTHMAKYRKTYDLRSKALMKTDTISVGFCVYVACETTLSIEHTHTQKKLMKKLRYMNQFECIKEFMLKANKFISNAVFINRKTD